jgi:hypothetical protein
VEPTAAVEPPPAAPTPAATPSTSGSAAAQAVDPGRLSSGVAPLPPPPKPTARPGRPHKKDDMTIEIPLPPEDLPPPAP